MKYNAGREDSHTYRGTSRVRREPKGSKSFTCDVCKKQFDSGRHNQISCKDCRRLGERMRAWNVDISEMTDMLLAQDFLCAACGITPVNVNSCIDHDHACCPSIRGCKECIRGVVCRPCNMALSEGYDNPEVAMRRVAYLLSNMSNTTNKEKTQ